MYPYLFGSEALSMYGIMLAAGLLAAILLFKFICNKKKVDDKTYTFYSLLAIISIAAGLGGAALFQSIYDMIAKAVAGEKVSFGYSGLTFMGGLITGVIVFVAGATIFAKGQVKRNFFECASYGAPCIVLGHAFGRFGCFFAGCCYGKVTDSFLGIRFPGMSQKVYPTQLFEALFLVLLFAAMMVLLFRFKNYKIQLPLYGMGYAVFRFLIEYVRGDDRGAFIPGLSPSQAQVILLFAVAAAVAVLVFKFDIVPFAKAADTVPAADRQDTASDTADDTIAANETDVSSPQNDSSDENDA